MNPRAYTASKGAYRMVLMVALVATTLGLAGCKKKKNQGDDSIGFVGLFSSDDETVDETASEQASAGRGVIQVWPRSQVSTTESGGQGSFNIQLGSRPTSGVTIAVSSSRVQEGTVSPSTVVFTPDNWNMPQVVSVTGVDDDAPDGPQRFVVVVAPAVSNDINFNGVDPKDVQAVNADNDQGGVIVEPTGGLVTSEEGQQATFTVRLQSRPKYDVTMALASSRANEGRVNPSTLTFSPNSWNTGQTVTITGVDDNLVDGNVQYNIEFRATTSNDIVFQGMAVPSVSVTNFDNDRAGITVQPTGGLVTTEAGGQATFSMILTAQPSAAVTVVMRSSAPRLSRLQPSSVVFSESNWNRPQVVTITGQDDGTITDRQSYTITLDPLRTSDPAFRSIDPPDVSVTSEEKLPGSIIYNPAERAWDKTPDRVGR